MIGLALHDNGDIRDLMTTRQTYIDRRRAMLYSVPFAFTGDWVKYEFPPESDRRGILTQISMLSMFSHPGRSSPTKRRVALREIFLCLPTPEPPNDVEFSAANDPNSTIRTLSEKLMAHKTNKACAACHQMTDPIELSLEAFDTIGGYRTTDNGKPIDVSANIQGKTFSGAQGLGQYLHDNPQYPACVARKLYSYSRGLKNSFVADFPDAFKAFQDSGFRLRALLKSIAVSDSFYAAGPPGNPSSNDSTEAEAQQEEDLMNFHRETLLRGSCHGALAVMGLPFLDCFLNSKGQAQANGRPCPRASTPFSGAAVSRLRCGFRRRRGPIGT